MRRLIILLAVVVTTLGSGPARAVWLEASSDHFIIDADTDEARLRDFASRLERFDRTLRTLYGVGDDPARRADRIRIFAVGAQTIGRLSGSRSIAGFYIRRPGRSLIFTAALAPAAAASSETGSHIATVKSYDLDAQTTLLHEYSHHFMYSNFPGAYPMWFSEGFAEFNGNARFNPDGTVTVGLAPTYRAYDLLSEVIPIEKLIDPPKDFPRTAKDADTFYGRAWLLTHYLMIEGKRQDALSHYLAALADSTPNLQAARASFGDLDEIGRATDKLVRSPRQTVISVPIDATPPAVRISPLSVGAAAMMPAEERVALGVTSATAADVAKDAEVRAAPYPSDARVETVLAEAEYDAHRDDRADAAADRALAADADDVGAMLCKGRIAARRLRAARSGDLAAWGGARRWFVRANHVEPNAAEPLLLYYDSFGWAGQSAPETAYQGLLRAQQLAPEAAEIRSALALRMIETGDEKTARLLLKPAAYAPHAPDEHARAALDALDQHRPDAARVALADRTLD